MLYAKSGEPRYPLNEHTSDVLNAIRKLRMIWNSIPTILDRAALFHDFGKAAKGFQSSLLPNGRRWGFRHEVLSAAIFKDCHNLSNEETMKSYLALLTHHKNLGSNMQISIAFQACQSLTPVSRWHDKWKELQHDLLKETFSAELSNWNYDPCVGSPANEVGIFIRNLKPVFEDLHQTMMRELS